MIENLDVILAEGESFCVEFKESPDKTLASEACAFANLSGGKILIGIDDKGNIIGTDISNAARSQIQDTINKIKPHLDVSISAHKNIIEIIVPEGKNKPYSCPQGFYIRSGPNSQKLERDDIIEFLQMEGKNKYDDIVRENLLVKDNFNKNFYADFLKKAGISDVLPFESVLINLNCAVKTQTGVLVYTNAGALFFRDNSADMFFEHAEVVCALYKGKHKANILDVKELKGSIVENIDNAILFLKRHLNLRYEIKTIRRKNILEIPEDALREAVINAVCHRDYFETGARVMVEIYDDRVEIVNPGGAPKGITKENFGQLSITRNPTIASMLHRIRYIERMGTGIMRMRQAMENAELDIPKFDFESFFKISFKRDELEDGGVNGGVSGGVNEGVNGGVNDTVKEGVNSEEGGGENDTTNDTVKDDANGGISGGANGGVSGGVNEGVNGGVNLSKNARDILDLISNDSRITLIEIAESIVKSENTVLREINKLKQMDIIERIGSHKTGYWKIKKQNIYGG
ncbi:MAG: putative DNA binding domain-containing protein [Elusimicrobiota bacterium]|nr:putative DNA binding domain-containing protein [Elusimicrobiota bacterium]